MITEAISNVFRAVAEFFGWRKQRDSYLNAADVKTAQTAQDVADADAKTDEALKSKNLDELRKESAE